MFKRISVLSVIFCLPPACGGGGDDGNTTDDKCPAGSGAIFVENGPQGPGCYCPAGLVPDPATQKCVADTGTD